MSNKNINEVQAIIAKLTLMNNHFMNKVFASDIAATQILLRVILKNDKISVKEVHTQSFIENLYGHSAQLDILAEDADGRQFNVEVQRSDEGAPAKRARFYSSALDMFFLDKGRKYEELNDSYVIFITENDVLNEGLATYSIERVIREIGDSFNDGSHIIYVNASCRDDSAVGRLMQDFTCNDPNKMHYKEIADRVRYLKDTKEGAVNMEDIIEIYAQKRAERAMKAEKLEFARSLLEDGMSIEFVVRHSKLSEKEVRELAAKLSA